MITSDNGLFLLLQVFSSGVAGYITNKYAVNMIFKEYTPLKIGGAVKKNKEKFIDEISDLVEKDIINSKTLKSQVLGDDFKASIQNMNRDLFEESLYEVFLNKKIEQIQGIDETLRNGEVFLSNNLKEVLPSVIKNIANHISIEDLLSDEQIYNIVDYIYKEVINNLESSDDLSKFISDLYEEQGQVYLYQLISKESEEKLTRIISCEIMNSIDEILSSNKETKLIVDKFLSIIDIKTLLKNAQKSLESKNIDDILTEDEISNLSLLIYEKLDEIIKSQDGIEKLNYIVEDILNSSKYIDLTLFEVLPIHFGKISSEYIIDLIRKAIPYLSSWITDNKAKIENIIDDAISESVDGIDDDLRKSMISKVKDSMLNNFASKNEIVDKIVSFIETYDINGENYYKLYSKIIKFLEETKIKDLIVLLEKNNLINKELIVNLILDKWNEEGKEISKLFLKRQTSNSFNKLINQDFDKLFNKYIKPKLYDLVIYNKVKIMSYLDKIIFNLSNDKIESLLNTKINNLFTKESIDSFSLALPSKIVDTLNKNKINYKKIINKEISSNIKNIKIQDILKDNEEQIVNLITEKILDFIQIKYNKYKSYEVKDLINKITSNKDLSEITSNKLYDNIKDNLPSLVDGRVKKLIYDNLIKLDEEEICNIAQSFMEKQLKPLSMFGAFLGVIVGLIFGITTTNINGAYGFYNNIPNTLIACFLMGIVGVMTNVIALWMIFCPYEKNKFIAKIPIFRVFSIGYIPSHKSSFASGMANFIDNELLSGSRVVDSFKLKRNDFKNHIISNLKDSNYMFILDFIRSKKSNISKKSYNFLLKLFRKNNNRICKTIENQILETKCSKILSLDLINEKAINLLKNISKQENNIIEYLEGKLKTSKSLEEVLPKDLINTINNAIEKEIYDYINKNIESLSVEDIIKNIIFKNEQTYNNMINKSFEDLLSDKYILSIQNSIKTDMFINIILLGLKEQLDNYLQGYLLKEFSHEKKIDEIFDGKIKEKLNKNIYNITDKGSEKFISYIKDNEDFISSMIIKIVRKNLNFFIKMAYDFADGDGLVKDVVNVIINNKIEHLLNEEKDKLSLILYDYLEKELYISKVEDFGLKPTEINTSLLLDRLVFELKQNEDFKENVYSIGNLIIDNILKINIKDISEIVGLGTVEQIYIKCKNPINLISNNINNSLINNKDIIYQSLNDLIEDKIMKHFYSISLVQLSWELNNDDLSYTVKNLLEKISGSEVLNKYILKVCRNTYKESVENIKLNSIMNTDILKKNIYTTLNSLLESKDFNDNNKLIINTITDKVLDSELYFISSEFKLYITEQSIYALFNTVQKNIIPILKSLNLQDITLEEVDKMHPKEIHDLFKSFAGDFFIKLYIYGFFGLIFGINVYLSIILFVIDVFYTKKIESKVEKSKYKLFRE